MYSGHQTSINTPGWGWMVRGERQVEVRVSCQNKTVQNSLAAPQPPQFTVLLKGRWKTPERRIPAGPSVF